ncbi:hydrocephalus-inducing protein homolog [Pungitius pungitius]|uniref:hydrocephalus-inducing protein homolog n=1 Tax=Pungitius pungitius TaxID=134920 RepID=UPI002E12402B
MVDTYEERDSKVEEMHSLSLKPAELLVSEMTVVGNSQALGQLEMTPVSRAIARHMRVDLSPEGLAARNRRGIAIIVYGAPLTDNGSCVAALARHYGGASLSVDAVVTEVLVNGTSPISQTARQPYDCAAAANAGKKPQEAAQSTEYEPETHPEASEPAPHSAPASRGTLEVPSKPIEDGFSGNGSKAPRGTENTHFTRCLVYFLLLCSSAAALSDCHRGIVIDGLESVYAQSAASVLQIILKALDNRKRIFVVNLSDSYDALKAREEAQREAKEALEKEKAEMEEPWLQELDDEEYDALPEEKKEHIDQRLTEKELGQEEKRLQEEMLKEEELKNNKKGGKMTLKEVSKEKSTLERKQTTAAVNVVPTSGSNNSKKIRVVEREQLPLNKGASRSHRSKEAKRLQAESSVPADKLEGEMPIQSIVDELQCQFAVYEQTQQQVDHILQHWDRARGLLLVPLPGDEAAPVPEDAPTEKQHPQGAEHLFLTAVGKKNKKHGSLPLPSQMSVPGFEGRIKASLTKNKDKKTRESQKSKRQSSDKTKAKGSDRSSSPRLPLSSTPDCAEQDQHKDNIKLKRSQRQGKTHTDTTMVFYSVLCCCCLY